MFIELRTIDTISTCEVTIFHPIYSNRLFGQTIEGVEGNTIVDLRKCAREYSSTMHNKVIKTRKGIG